MNCDQFREVIVWPPRVAMAYFDSFAATRGQWSSRCPPVSNLCMLSQWIRQDASSP